MIGMKRLLVLAAAVMTFGLAVPVAAQANGYALDTVCTGVPNLSNADATVCMETEDGWNGRTAWYVRWGPSGPPWCGVEWFALWGYSCGTNRAGHYWNARGRYNVDWADYVVNTAVSIPGTTFAMRYCVNIDINRAPNGADWKSQAVWVIYPWQRC